MTTILSDMNEVFNRLADEAKSNGFGSAGSDFKTCPNWEVRLEFFGKEEAEFVFKSDLNFDDDQLPQVKGFNTNFKQWISVGTKECTTHLYVKRTEGNSQLFRLMISDAIQDLVNNDANAVQSFEIVLSRIQQWSGIFSHKTRSNMALDDEIGLFGKLSCLNSILEMGFEPLDTVLAWKGPDQGIHDFSFHNCDIEVKSTLEEKNFPVRIFNQGQLDTPSGTSLWLCGYRLTRSETKGKTLFSLIELIREKLESSERARDKFDVLLGKAGWLDEYKNRMQNRFVISKNYYWKVHETFPRIVPSNLMPGITSVSYRIDLVGRAVDAKNIKQVFKNSME